MSTTTALKPDMSKVLALLATGHTLHAAAEHIGWPIGSVRAVVNGQKGWMLDANGRVYDPGQPGYRVRLPDGVNPVHIEWASNLRGPGDAPRSIQFQEPQGPAVAKQTPPPAAPSRRPATPAAAVNGSAAIDGTLTTELPIDRIHDHTANIRDAVGDITDLAASIRAHGLLQPVTVRPHPDKPRHYQLLAGHRRRAAALEAGLTTLPAVIRHDVDDATAVELMIVENVQRTDLGPIEKAEAFGRLRDQHGYSASKIGKQVGLSQATVSHFLSLLELAPAAREQVRAGALPVGDAIDMVRRYRAQQRKKTGGGRTDWTWEPDILANTHPLAKQAMRACEARGHTSRRRIGNIACGQCWETAIRTDERLVVTAELTAGEQT